MIQGRTEWARCVGDIGATVEGKKMDEINGLFEPSVVTLSL